jgi:hypothetical protein
MRARLNGVGQEMTTCDRRSWGPVFALFLFFGLSADLRAQTNEQVPGCRDVASLPPVLAFVGPATTPAGADELSIAGGAWGNLFPAPCAHETGADLFGRWDRGVTDRFDLGADFQISQHSNFQTLSAQVTARYELWKNLRLEAGIGLGDDTEGKSYTGEVGATMGIRTWSRNWAPYASVRLAVAHGNAGRPFAGSNLPPGALVPMASFGASARVAENMRWVLEGGGGGIVSREHLAAGTFVYMAVGLDFVLPRRKR